MPKAVKPIDLYPLRFNKIFRKKIWGGSELKKFLSGPVPAKTGESWELSCRGKDVSLVANGPYKGRRIDELFVERPKEILGDEHSMRFSSRFPLLIKVIGVHERMSLQVHPSDDFAQRYETESYGKMEAWYVLVAPKGSRVIRGVLPGTTVAEFRQHLTDGKIEQCLNVMDVKEGDIIFIPPGTIHSAYGGLVALEVQQNSDVTYRLSDWGRKDFNGRERPLNVEKAMNVTDFYSMGVSKYKAARIPGFPYRRCLLIKCEKFTMESISVDRGRIKDKSNPARFAIYTPVAGKGKFFYGPKKKTAQPWKRGETYLIPAHLGEFDIAASGSSEIVVTYVE